jgi:uncharacterized delta-60 repeat protein
MSSTRSRAAIAGARWTTVVVGACIAFLVAAGTTWATGVGSLDTDFSDDGWATAKPGGAGSFDIAEGVALQPNGKLVAVGSSGRSVLHTDVGLARFKANGRLDAGFAKGGTRTIDFARRNRSDAASAVAIQRNGRIVVTGFAARSSNSSKLLVARFKPSGRLDPTFSRDGRTKIAFPGRAGAGGEALAIQRDGRIVVAGSVSSRSGGDMAVVRLTPNGRLDRTFSGDGRRTIRFPREVGGSEASGVAIRRDGMIVVGGFSVEAGHGRDFAVASLRPDGDLDRHFSNDGRATFGFGNGSNDDQAAALALGPGGEIALAGAVLPMGAAEADFGVLVLDRAGRPDPAFSDDGRVTFGFNNPNEVDFATGIAFQPRGKLVVGGTSEQGVHAREFAVARLLDSGGFDQGFGQDGRRTEELSEGTADDEANSMVIQPDGDIVLAGLSAPDDRFNFALARFLGDAS